MMSLAQLSGNQDRTAFSSIQGSFLKPSLSTIVTPKRRGTKRKGKRKERGKGDRSVFASYHEFHLGIVGEDKEEAPAASSRVLSQCSHTLKTSKHI